jgi:3'-phosphoadenosine 5'-phosphosulfate (PAPS) 3'-phosphatase
LSYLPYIWLPSGDFSDLIYLKQSPCFLSFSTHLVATHAHVLTYLQDHAPGSLLVTEAGGTITDSRGELLDFGLGRDLGENFGVIAAGKDVHDEVLATVKQALEEQKAKV